MATPREVLAEIVQKARENKDFFYALVSDPAKALAGMEGIDEATKTRLRALSPESFLVAPLAKAIGRGLSPCDPTCDESCTMTCGDFSCDVTCGPENKSCNKTCGISCGKTLSVAAIG